MSSPNENTGSDTENDNANVSPNSEDSDVIVYDEDDDSKPTTYGSPMTREEWLEETAKADSWDSSIRKRKKFEASHPREKALKLLRDGRQQYLLNRSRLGIEELRYRCPIFSDFGQKEKSTETFKLVDFPPESFVGIGSTPGEAQRSRTVVLTYIRWTDGIEREYEAKMREWSLCNGGTTASAVKLSYVPRIPTVYTN